MFASFLTFLLLQLE